MTNKIYSQIIKIIFIFYTLIAPLVLVRQLGFYFVGHIWKIIHPLVFLLALYLFLKKKPQDFFAVILIFLPIYSLLITFYNLSLGLYGGEYFVGYSFRPLIVHIYTAISALVLYIAFSDSLIHIESHSKLIEKILFTILISYGASLFLVYAIFLSRGGFYLGFSCKPLLLVISFYLLKKKPATLIFILFLILISGKRGILLSVPFMFLIYFFISKHFIVKSVKFFSLFGIFIYVLTVYLLLDKLPFLESSINKLQRMTEVSNFNEIAIASSGRSLELYYLSNVLSEANVWWQGLGYGFKYELWNMTNEYSMQNHYVHFTPFNYIAQYGLVSAVIFYVCIIYYLTKSIFIARMSNNFWYTWLVVSAWGYFLAALTSYFQSADPMYWFLIGGAIGGGRIVKARTGRTN